MGAQASRLHDCPQPQRGGTIPSQGNALGIGKKRRSGKPQRGDPNIAQGNALGMKVVKTP
jgi:hypothetical protein